MAVRRRSAPKKPAKSKPVPAPNRNDPYLILLRRELIRAQARLRRAERERDQARTALARLTSATENAETKKRNK